MRLLLNRKFVFFFIPYLLLYIISSRNALLWDTIQFAGDHPNWYYSQHFRYLLLPDSCDSGHPPAFGMYLALLWEIFGRSLLVSHTAMLPFVLLLVAQGIRTGELLFPDNKKYAFLVTLVLLSESLIMTQCTLVTPDVPVIAFFLLALNALLGRSRWQLTLAVLFMGILSTRAMMSAFVLYLFALSYNRIEAGRGLKNILVYLLRQVMPFLPGALLAIAYFSWHYAVKGWIGYHKDSPWAAGFEIMPLPRIALNTLILGWRLVDLGKILTVAVFVVMLVRWLRRKATISMAQNRIIMQSFFVLFLGLFFFTSLPLAMYQGLLTHRYFLPLTICMSLVAVFLLLQQPYKHKVTLVCLMVLVQCSGHFWTYPRRISQGWEGTLGHLYFYPMRKEFKAYMEQQGIRKQDVATSPTLMQSDYRIDLTDDTTAYRDFEIDTAQYVWYCNVSNAMNKRVDYYFDHFKIVKQEKRGHVEMVLFKRPEP